MANSKELKAIISIAGTIDPSLAKSISAATKQTGMLGTALRGVAKRKQRKQKEERLPRKAPKQKK